MRETPFNCSILQFPIVSSGGIHCEFNANFPTLKVRQILKDTNIGAFTDYEYSGDLHLPFNNIKKFITSIYMYDFQHCTYVCVYCTISGLT